MTTTLRAILLMAVCVTACQIRPVGSPTVSATSTSAAPSTVAPTVTPIVAVPDLKLTPGPALADLPPGWTQIYPGGDTACAFGSPFAYWVRPGASSKLLVYLAGGGGCWNADTCRDTGQEFNGYFDTAVTPSDTPAALHGILDLSHPENPFADYTMVYIPSCNGDVFWGDTVHTFESDTGAVTVNFKGFVNAAAALEWAYANVPRPASVFVTGCSAGSGGSILHAPYVIEHYPGVPVYQLGDSLALISDGPVQLGAEWGVGDTFPNWIPGLATLTDLPWTTDHLYAAIAGYYPDHVFAQYNTSRDNVQVFYTFPTGNGDATRWARLLDEHLARIQSAAPNFRSFTAGGDLHCILSRREFYSYAVDGARLRDWVAALANGRDVPTLHCTDCAMPELIGR